MDIFFLQIICVIYFVLALYADGKTIGDIFSSVCFLLMAVICIYSKLYILMIVFLLFSGIMALHALNPKIDMDR